MELRDHIVTIVTLMSSVGLHMLVLPMVYTHTPTMAYPIPSKATHLKTPTPENQEIALGIDNSEASTLTWIGYEEYEEQRARFTEVEQAAMKAEVDAAQPNPSIMVMKQIAKPIAELAEQFIKALREIDITLPSKDLPSTLKIPTPPESAKKTTETVEVAQVETPAESIDEVNVKETTKTMDTALGDPSDRDSDATSIIHISPDQLKSGKPIAANGIVLRPRRPSFTANQLVTNSPSGLVADLHIGKLGKPMEVVILVSTGSASIDRSIKASLFRWRASGDRISELVDDETIKITIRLIFSR